MMTAAHTPTTPAAAADRTLYLLDDNAEFRTTAKWWLGGLGYQVLDFEDPRLAIESLRALAPASLACACLLLDVRMPAMSGLQVHDELIEAGITGPQAKQALPIIYMTGHGDVPLAVQAMEKGAITFLEKPFQDQALELALERAFTASQHPPAQPETKPKPVIPNIPGIEYQRRLATLTPREAEIFTHMQTGNTSKIIARTLGVTPKNIEHFRGRVMKKMKADSFAHLIRMAVNKRVF